MDKVFVKKLLEDTNDHKEWVKAMLYGMPSLIEDKDFLMEEIIKESLREWERKNRKAKAEYHLASKIDLYPITGKILKELALEIQSTGIDL